MIGLAMFATALVLLLIGFPVAFTFGGAAVISACCQKAPASLP